MQHDVYATRPDGDRRLVVGLSVRERFGFPVHNAPSSRRPGRHRPPPLRATYLPLEDCRPGTWVNTGGRLEVFSLVNRFGVDACRLCECSSGEGGIPHLFTFKLVRALVKRCGLPLRAIVRVSGRRRFWPSNRRVAAVAGSDGRSIVDVVAYAVDVLTVFHLAVCAALAVP